MFPLKDFGVNNLRHDQTERVLLAHQSRPQSVKVGTVRPKLFKTAFLTARHSARNLTARESVAGHSFRFEMSVPLPFVFDDCSFLGHEYASRAVVRFFLLFKRNRWLGKRSSALRARRS